MAVAFGVPARATFRPRDRLTHARQFEAVYAAGCRATKGPVSIFAIGNDLSHPRLGLAVARGSGTAATRNRIKRLIREAFRRTRENLPSRDGGDYDYVVAVKPHEPRDLYEYEKLLFLLGRSAARAWDRRAGLAGGGR